MTKAFDPQALRDALAAVSEDWSLPSSFKATGVHQGNRRIVVVANGLEQAPAAPFRFVLESFVPVHTAWLSWIDPGGFIVAHRDGGPYRERWQMPISTAGWFMQAGQLTEATDGEAFQVSHWDCHAVANPTDRERIHLVVDRDVMVDHPSQPFAKCPPIPEMADLIART